MTAVLDQVADAYPGTWDDFVGQEGAKRQLRVACASAKARGVPLGHVLLASGMAGVGKTALGMLVVAELGTGMAMASGKMTVNDARITLSGLADRDVLFIDEIHRMVAGGKRHAEWLLHLLADGVLMGPLGPERQPAVTVIAATTDVGRLPETIVSRFGLQPVIEPYSDDDAGVIAARMAGQVILRPLPFVSPDDCRAVARAASNNPRVIGAILANLRDLATVDLASVHDGQSYDLTEALAWLGLSEDGLTKSARDYLAVLLGEFQGQAGERALADRLGEPGGLRHTEKMLMDRGYLAKTRSGRVLTRAGIDRAKELA